MKQLKFLFGLLCSTTGFFMTLGLIILQVDGESIDPLWIDFMYWLVLGALPIGVGVYCLYPASINHEKAHNTD